MKLKVAFVLLLSVAAAHQQYCKCECNGQLLVKNIDKCGLCTKQWCLEQNKNLCLDQVDADNILISCFQIESAKEKVVVLLFVVAVVGLLVGGYWR